MSKKPQNELGTEDFGAPVGFWQHYFYVETPPGNREPVLIYEDYGLDNEEDPSKQDTSECRCILERELWTKIRDEAKHDFNTRLKENKQSTGQWNKGRVKLEKFLGKELCVLAWAAEHSTPDECFVIVQRWLSLRPEERWWLYSKTAAEAGKAEDRNRGWRKALYCCLSDGENIKMPQKKPPKSKRLKAKEDTVTQQPTLF